MEGAGCIKALVLAVTQYQHSHTDANSHHLLTTIEALMGHKAVVLRHPEESRDGRDVLGVPAECVSDLVSLLGHPRCSHALAIVIVNLFSLLAAERQAVRERLHAAHDLTGGLAQLVQRLQAGAQLETPLLLQALKLLQLITYGARVSYLSPSLEELLLFLVQQIQAPESERMLPCLGTMANLCRHNASVQSHIKAMGDVKAVYRALVMALAHSSLTVVVFSLSLLATLTLHEQVGIKLFHARNLDQTLQLIFNILLNGDGTLTRTFSVDLCVDLLRSERVANHLCGLRGLLASVELPDIVVFRLLGFEVFGRICRYEHFDSCLQKILGLLRDSETESNAKLLELLLALCTAPRLRSSIGRAILAPAGLAAGDGGGPGGKCGSPPAGAVRRTRRTTATNGDAPSVTLATLVRCAARPPATPPGVPLMALRLLLEIYREALAPGFPALPEVVTARLVVPALTEALREGAATTAAAASDEAQTRRCLKVTHSLDLMMLLSVWEGVAATVGAAVETGGLLHLLQEQLEHNLLSSGRSLAPSSPHYAACEAGADVLLKGLELLSRLKQSLPSLEANLYQILQDMRLVPFLAFALASASRERVQCGLRVLIEASQLPDFPAVTLGESIAARNYESEGSTGVPVSPVHPPHHHPHHHHPHHQWRAEAHHHHHHQAVKMTPDPDTVQQLIEKIRSGMEITDVVRDVKPSEIIDVYEQKLASLATKEQQLLDLLEARSVALAQADRLMKQHRCHRDNSENEARRLAGMLSQAERRVEELRAELAEQQVEAERAREDMEVLLQHNRRLQAAHERHALLAAQHADLQHRLEVNERQLAKTQEEQRSVTELADVLRRHNDALKQSNDKTMCQLGEMEGQCKELRKVVQEREVKISGLQHSLQASEEAVARAGEEAAHRQEALDAVRKDLSRTEQQRKELSIKASSLEVQKRSVEAQLKERDARLREQQEELGKHASMIAAIHSLSSGAAKAPNFSL